MLQNENDLRNRIDTWESAQTGLPDGSEIVWEKLEREIVGKMVSRNRISVFRWTAAASFFILLGAALYWVSNRISLNPARAFPLSSSPTKEIAKPKMSESLVAASKSENRQHRSTLAQVTSKSLVASEIQSSDTVVVVMQETAAAPLPQNLSSTSIVNEGSTMTADPSIVEKPLPRANITYWNKNVSTKKVRWQLPVIHQNEANSMPANSVQWIQDERLLRNLELPPPADAKPFKWISLQPMNNPASTGIKQ